MCRENFAKDNLVVFERVGRNVDSRHFFGTPEARQCYTWGQMPVRSTTANRDSAEAFRKKVQTSEPQNCDDRPRSAGLAPFFFWGIWALLSGIGMYFAAILLSILRLILLHPHLFVGLIE